MTKRWIGLVPCASFVVALAISCSSTDGGGNGGNSGSAGTAGSTGASGGGGGGGGGDGGVDHSAGAAGEMNPVDNAGAAGVAGTPADNGGAAGEGGASGSAGSSEGPTPLNPAQISNLAFWLDGNAQSFSDIDENYPTLPDSGRVRSVHETAPLTGSWQAPSSAERPIRELGALNLRPVGTNTGYFLRDTVGTIQTDDSTLAISFVPLSGKYGPAQGGLSAPIGTSPQSLGIYFVGDQVGIYFNHSQAVLNKHFSRGVHTTMIVRFTATGVDVQYDINGLRTSESVVATVAHETASNFVVGFDSNFNAGMYGYVSQVVGVNRAVSDSETTRLMSWLTEQPIPQAFPATKPLVAIVGDSIAIGEQVPGYQSWAFSMLDDLSDTHPDVQLLNAAKGGSGVPKVKDSDYSDFVLPWYSAARAKNVLLVAAGTNDLANGSNLSDIQDRYWGLLDSARATGWKVVACTLLPRSDPSMVVGVAGFEAERTTFNNEIIAHWAQHADALANVAAITHLGAAGDSDNTAYYSVDKVHPLAPGHALLEPVYRAAVAGLL